MDDIFAHLKPKRDFGMFIRPKINNNDFILEQIEIASLVVVDDVLILASPTYEYQNETFNTTLLFSREMIEQMAENIGMLDEDLADFLQEKFDGMLTDLEPGEEIWFPDNKSLSFLLNTKLDLTFEKDLHKMPEPYIPFIVKGVLACGVVR